MPHGFKGLPGAFRTDVQKLARGIWPWSEGVKARLPEHYRQRLMEKHSRQPMPVHFKPDERKFTVDKYGTRLRVHNVPIPLKHVPEADRGLWGGEAFVVGLRKKNDNPMKPRTPQIWKPRLKTRVFYSEILDRWMSIVVTPRTMDLIDQAYGFDNYILQTHEVDLQSKLGMALKREMLLALVTKSLYPGNPERREKVFDKYRQFAISEEEVPWVGLTLEEAEERQLRMEKEEALRTRRPLKEVYCEQLIESLKNPPEEESEGDSVDEETSSLLKRLNPFKSSEAKS